MWQSKKTVCREVFSNWVQKFSEMVDENQSELDVEAVTVFREQKQDYLEGVADDSPSVASPNNWPSRQSAKRRKARESRSTERK